MSTLRELAEYAATRAPDQEFDWYTEDYLMGVQDIHWVKNIRFIAEASPNAVLDLYKKIDALEADREVGLVLLASAQDTAGRMLTERDAARVERDKAVQILNTMFDTYEKGVALLNTLLPREGV